MKWFFDMDNPIMTALSIIADTLILNLLTLLCSLPVITAGAAIAAMNDLTIHIIRREEGSMFRGYFRSFRANFRQATLLWLLILAAAGLLYFDYLAAEIYVPPMRLGIAAIGILLLALVLYAFPLLTRYENSLRVTLKNAASLAVGFFPKTLGMLAFTLVFWLLCIRYIRWGAPVLIMFGFSLPCYVCALLLNPVFAAIEK
ncbi:MAG: DUF624 domain-containing protein [Oscillospiraceae bacterium]|nr:DUF624 domain-containing protein [Oscillospiraceae bacterium]